MAGPLFETEDLIREFPKALINWYDFRPDSKILYIGQPDSYADVLKDYTSEIVYADCKKLKDLMWQEKRYAFFDYAVCIETLELEKNLSGSLTTLRKMLKPTGILLLGMNNRLGLRYFCGDRDPYTNRSFDGIDVACQNFCQILSKLLSKLIRKYFPNYNGKNQLSFCHIF